MVNFVYKQKKLQAQILTHPSEISARFQTTFHFDSPGGVAASGI